TSASATTPPSFPPNQANKTNATKTMFSTLPSPTYRTHFHHSDFFSYEDIRAAFRASASHPRNNLTIRIAKMDETPAPPPSPVGFRDDDRREERR
ncbi:hypothetical protein LTR28_009112, partial [Elasticomyces elasticus]